MLALLIIVAHVVTERRLHPPKELCVNFGSPSTRGIVSTCIGRGGFAFKQCAGKRHLHKWREPLLASFVLATRKETRDCIRLEGRSALVRARGAEDGAEVHEALVLLRPECHLQLASEMSLYVGDAQKSPQARRGVPCVDPEVLSAVFHWHLARLASHSTARLGLPHGEDVSQAWSAWKRAGCRNVITVALSVHASDHARRDCSCHSCWCTWCHC